MKRIAGIILVLLAGLASAQTTPNIGLNQQVVGRPGFGPGIIANWTMLDNYLGGTTALPRAFWTNANIMAYRGLYISSMAYNVNDVVVSAGASYLSLTALNVGNLPASSPAQWALIGGGGTPGPPGVPGTNGINGTNGTNGAPGAPGAAATVAVGTVTTGPAAVVNGGTSSNAVLNFTVPQGIPGTNGTNGTNGAPGASATVAVDSTVTPLAAGATPTATNLGTASAANIHFGIPAGAAGAAGAPGAPGGNAFSVMSYAGNSGGAIDNSAAITAACAANGQVYFPVGTYNVTANYTIPCAEEFQVGAALRAANGVTITLNPSIRAYNYQQIFTWAGTGSFVGLAESRPEWFGAVGYATKAAAGAGLDYSANLQAALNAIANGGQMLLKPVCYNATAGLSISWPSVDIEGANGGGGDEFPIGSSSCLVTTAALGTTIYVHGTSANPIFYNKFENFSIEGLTQPTGTDPTASVGIFEYYALGARINDVQVNDRLDGFRFVGSSNGYDTYLSSNNGWVAGINSYVSGQIINAFDFDSTGGAGNVSHLVVNGGIAIANSAAGAGVISSGIYDHGSVVQDLDFDYPSSNNASYAARIVGTGGGVQDIHIDHPTFEARVSAVYISGITGVGSAPSVEISDGYLHSNLSTTKIVDCENSMGVRIVNNEFVTNGAAAYGIYSNGCSGLIAGLNTFENLPSGIAVGLVNTSSSTFTGNNANTVGTFFSLSTNSVNNAISGNTVTGTGTTGYTFDSTSAVNDVVANPCGPSIGTCYAGTTPLGASPSFLAVGSTAGGQVLGGGTGGMIENWYSQENQGLVFSNSGFDYTNSMIGTNTTQTSGVSGFLGKVTTYNGTSSASNATTASGTAFDGSRPFSVCATVNLTLSNSVIFSNLDSAAGNPGYSLRAGTSGNLDFYLIHIVGSLNLIEVQSANGTLTSGVPYRVCVTYDGSTTAGGVGFFVNGRSVTPTVVTNALVGSITSALPLRIGAETNGTLYSTGSIGNVRVWNRKITAADGP